MDKLLDQRDQLRRATKMAAKDTERAVEVRDDQAILEAEAKKRFAEFHKQNHTYAGRRYPSQCICWR